MKIIIVLLLFCSCKQLESEPYKENNLIDSIVDLQVELVNEIEEDGFVFLLENNAQIWFDSMTISRFADSMYYEKYSSLSLSPNLLDSIINTTNISFDRDKKEISQLKFENGFISADLEIKRIDGTSILLLFPNNVIARDKKFYKENFGFFLLYKNTYYYFGRWPLWLSNNKDGRRHHVFSSIVRLDKNFEMKSYVQIHFENFLSLDFTHRIIVPDNLSNKRLALNFYNYEDFSLTYFFDILDEYSIESIKSKKERYNLSVQNSNYLNKVIWFYSGNIYYNEDTSKRSRSSSEPTE